MGLIEIIVRKFFLPNALKKDKEFQELSKKADKSLSDFEKAVNDQLKSSGEDPIRIKKH